MEDNMNTAMPFLRTGSHEPGSRGPKIESDLFESRSSDTNSDEISSDVKFVIAAVVVIFLVVIAVSL